MTLAILLLSRSGGPTHDASFFTPQYDFWRSVFTKMAFCQMLVSWNQSSFKKMQPMAAAEVALKSPLIPLFQRGNYSIAVLTPLWKRGEGEISTRRYGNYLTNFNSRTLGSKHLCEVLGRRYRLVQHCDFSSSPKIRYG